MERYFENRLLLTSRDGLRPADYALMYALPRGKEGAKARALVFEPAYGAVAAALRLLNPGLAEVCAHYPDAWDRDRAAVSLDAALGSMGLSIDAKVTLHLGADPPPGPWTHIALPVPKQGIADLVRERIRRAAVEWLAPNGLLHIGAEAGAHRLVAEELEAAFGSATRTRLEDGSTAFISRRPKEPLLGGAPSGQTEFNIDPKAFAEAPPLRLVSRLGVFCPDRLDDGTRALLAEARTPPVSPDSGPMRLLDLGCGCGVVGIVQALKLTRDQPTPPSVLYLDSDARAVEAARANVEAHGLDAHSEFIVSADAPQALKGQRPFQWVLANPPYYGHWRIAEAFLVGARAALGDSPTGRLTLVTKAPDWWLPRLVEGFRTVAERKRGGYTVFEADGAR